MRGHVIGRVVLPYEGHFSLTDESTGYVKERGDVNAQMLSNPGLRADQDVY